MPRVRSAGTNRRFGQVGASERVSWLAPGAAERAWLRCGLDSLSRRPIEAGGTLENAQAMAAHESPRTTKLYDRTGDEITLDEVERIRI